MRLEDVTAEIRPRAPWESIDLGCSLARKHLVDIWKAWSLTVFPLWIILALLLRNHPVLLFLCIWWFKPLYDRVTLMVVSRALFGATPNSVEVLKAWPKMLFRRFWFALFIGRFSPARSLTLPVAELEGLRGASYRQRVNLLERNGGEGATMATLAGMFLALITGVGLVMLVMVMVPGHVSAEWWEGLVEFFQHDSISEFSVGFFWLAVGVLMFATTVMEPFYVSAGFALYVNSRTLTEGWDIELAFKRLGARLAKVRSSGVSKTGAALFLITLFGIGSFTNTHAADDGYQDSAREVLADEDFKIHHRNVEVPVEKTGNDNSFLEKLGKFFSGAGVPAFMGVIGLVLFYLILVAVIGGIIYLIIRNRHIFQSRGGGQRAGQLPRTEAIMGMDVRPESLPDDVVGAAREAWKAGNSHLALSLLYRGSIAWLVHRETLPIEESDTEGDCLRRLQSAGQRPYTPYFSDLTGMWVSIAYGKQQPEDSSMEDICDRWPFETMSSGSRGRSAQ